MNEGNERDLGRLQERTNQDDNAERREKKKRKKTRHHHGHRHHHDKSRKHHHGDEHHTHASGRPRQALNTTAETVDYDSESEMERGERAGGSFAQHVPWTSANEEMQPRAPIKTPCLGIANESKFNDYDEQVEEGYDCFGDAVAHLSDRLDETPTQQEQELRPSTLAVDLSGETQVYPGVLSPSPSSRVDSLPGNSNPLNPTSSRLLSARPVDPDEDRRMLREELRNVLAEQQAAAIAPVVQAIPADNVPVANLPRDEAHSPQDYVHDDDSSVSSASSRGKGCTLKQWMIYGGIAAALALAGLAVGLVFAFQEDKQKDPLSPTLAPSPSTTITTSRPTIQPTISSFPQPTGQEMPEPSFSPVTLPTTSFPVTKSPTVSPTRLPTPAPTTLPPSPTPTTLPPSPSPTMPTQAPIAIPQDLVDLISIHSFDAGAASRIPGTPQNKALNWLARNENIDSYSDDRKIQRYALATVYYSTGGGETWDPFGLWLTDERECGSWGNAISCEVGSVVSFEQNGFMEGTIPNEIALLSNLVNLNLADSKLLTGIIPRTIGDLTNLILLDFSRCGLEGPIPSFIGRLTNLEKISLSVNSLTSSIPTEIVQLTNLVDSSFHGNKLSGPIPVDIGQMTSLQTFDVYTNSLTGPVPTSISQNPLTSIRFYENLLTGTIPSEITEMMQLKELRLDINQLTGTIPSGIHGMTNLAELRLYNNTLTGSFTCPDFIGACFISCKNGYAVCCRWFLLTLMVAGIVFSCLTVASCHFLKYIDSNGKQGAVGLYRYYDVSTSQCINHDDSVQYTESENAARMGAVVAPMAAGVVILIVLLEFCVCRFICSRLLMGLGLLGALIMQGLSFLLFDSEKFCNGDIITEILHQEPCTVGDGAVFSVVALLLYFVSGVLVFCTPKPEPMRTKHVNVESSASQHSFTSNGSVRSPSVNVVDNDVESTPMGSTKSATWT